MSSAELVKQLQKSLAMYDIANIELTQLTFTCSKSMIEILEKGVKYVQS